MRIIDEIEQAGKPFNILDCGRDDLPQFFKDMGYKVGAEIGVYKGEFTEKLCKVGLKIYGIDPWIVYKDYRKHPGELPYDELEKITRERLKSYDCVIIKKTSMDALEDIPDESLDFVYIDGNHALPYVVQDIYEWNRKVKKGGCISGHDYFNANHNPYWIRICHVKYAVDICAKIFGIENYYKIGNKDKCPSWLWIKK
jgi:hypothetical protein